MTPSEKCACQVQKRTGFEEVRRALRFYHSGPGVFWRVLPGSYAVLLWRMFGGTSLAIWVWLACFRGRFWKLQDRLPLATGKESGVSVSALIPARDEAELIGRTIVSLKGQQFDGRLRIVVADDQSSDATGAIATAAGADQVVEVSFRPPEWKGKLWALQSAVQGDESNPEYFLFTDADIEYFSPHCLSSLVAQAERGYDLVSIMVKLRCESRAETLLIPAFVFFFFMLYPPAWVASKRETAAAAGGCVLIGRETLLEAGGIESIRSALIDDCALARRVKEAGGRVWLGTSELPIRSTRAYGSADEIRAMIARSAFAQLRHSTLLLAGTVCAMLVTYLAGPILLFSGDPIAAGLGVAGWLLSTALFSPTVREYRAPLWTIVCLPGIALFYLWATIESAVRYWAGRGGEWKGRLQDAR